MRPSSARSSTSGAIGLTLAGLACSSASATLLLGTLYGDSYIVREGGRTYSVLDVYIKGTSTADIVISVFGTSQYPSVYAVSGGKAFVQSNGTAASSWLPTNDDGKAWDSFVTCGARVQGSDNTQAGGKAGFLGIQLDTNWAGASSGSVIVGQAGGAGWYPSIGASTSTNPYCRVGYNGGTSTTTGYWNTAQCARNVSGNGVSVGQSLSNHWMIGRFVIEVTDDEVGRQETLTLRFAVAGKQNGTSTGTFFTSPSPGSNGYVLKFAPRPCDGDIDCDGLCDGWDLGLLLLDFGPCPNCPSDIDGSGTVDTGDMSLLLMDWNAPC